MPQHLNPSMTKEQIDYAIQLWNNADEAKRWRIYATMLNCRALYRQSTLDKLGDLIPRKKIAESDLTEEMVNTMGTL